MFGQTMFHDLLDRYTDQGMAVLAVCAHEFGHIAQFRAGVRDRLLRGQRTVKRMELHADLLSGYFLGYRKRIDGQCLGRRSCPVLDRGLRIQQSEPPRHTGRACSRGRIWLQARL